MELKDFLKNVSELELSNKIEVEIVEAITQVMEDNANKIEASELKQFYDDNKSLDKEWGQDIIGNFYDNIISGRCENCFEFYENEDLIRVTETEEFQGAPASYTVEVGYRCQNCNYKGTF